VLLAGGCLFGYLRYKTLQHEDELQRHRNELERQRLLAIERENQRRTEELEQARAIQLSLLPKQAPRLPHLEIAVRMLTATEVGGDYYDFFPLEDGSLYVVTGDATGHGMSAGLMVSMTKSALKAVEVKPPDELLTQLNNVIRAVNLERMQMALNAIHITDDNVLLSSAGMPPPLLYRAGTGDVEEFMVEGLPLGGLEESDYELRIIEPRAGDTLVLISDGLPEARNVEGNLLGYESVQARVAELGDRSAEQILEELLRLGDEWSRDGSLEDDITVMVFKWLSG
jgi:serine phosphatase RsbU (regulator of sigma subunit)